jgi:hypothetical protein
VLPGRRIKVHLSKVFISNPAGDSTILLCHSSESQRTQIAWQLAAVAVPISSELAAEVHTAQEQRSPGGHSHTIEQSMEKRDVRNIQSHIPDLLNWGRINANVPVPAVGMVSLSSSLQKTFAMSWGLSSLRVGSDCPGSDLALV